MFFVMQMYTPEYGVCSDVGSKCKRRHTYNDKHFDRIRKKLAE